MLQVLYVGFYLTSVTAILEIGNFNVFYDHQAQDSEITQCVSNIINTIGRNAAFRDDVILTNINENLQISKLHGLVHNQFIVRTFAWSKMKKFNRIYVTSTVDFTEFKNGLEMVMYDYYFNPQVNFIILLEKFDEKHQKEMIKFLVSANIYNVSIIAMDSDRPGTIYSFHSPIHPCNHDQKIVAVSHCTNFTSNSNIFPKMAGIRGCRFQLMTYNIFPLVNLDDPKEEGVEQRVLNIFQEHSGVKIELIPYAKMDKFGSLTRNFTYTDILAKVLNNEVEGAVGGYFVAYASVYNFSFSYPLTIGHMLVVLPRADFKDTWHGFLDSKARYVFVMVFISFICFSVAAYVLSLFPSRDSDGIRDILIVFGYLVNKVTIRKFKNGIPETIIIGVFLFTIFIIPYTIQSYMWSMKTNPIRGWEPNEFNDVQGYRQLIITPDWLKQGLTKNRIECNSIIECLRKVRDKRDKSYYTFVTDETYETFKWMLADEQCNLRLYKLKEPIGILMRATYFRRGSVLYKEYNDFFFKIMSAGLVDHHYEEIAHREHLRCKPQFHPTTAPLNQNDFKFAYTLLITGYCISIVSFAFEIIPRMF